MKIFFKERTQERCEDTHYTQERSNSETIIIKKKKGRHRTLQSRVRDCNQSVEKKKKKETDETNSWVCVRA